MKYIVTYKFNRNISSIKYSEETKIIEIDFKILNKNDVEKLHHFLVDKKQTSDLILLSYKEQT